LLKERLDDGDQSSVSGPSAVYMAQSDKMLLSRTTHSKCQLCEKAIFSNAVLLRRSRKSEIGAENNKGKECLALFL
jgi:hypothetical protein